MVRTALAPRSRPAQHSLPGAHGALTGRGYRGRHALHRRRGRLGRTARPAPAGSLAARTRDAQRATKLHAFAADASPCVAKATAVCGPRASGDSRFAYTVAAVPPTTSRLRRVTPSA